MMLLAAHARAAVMTGMLTRSDFQRKIARDFIHGSSTDSFARAANLIVI